MLKALAKLKVILSLAPVVSALVHAAENQIVGSGKGAARLDFVMKNVDRAISVAGDIHGFTHGDLMEIAHGIVQTTVQAMNANGHFVTAGLVAEVAKTASRPR